MKKRLLALTLALCTLLLCSCTLNDLKALINDLLAMSGLSGNNVDYNMDASLSYPFDDTITKNMEERYRQIDEILKSGNKQRYAALDSLYSQQMDDYSYISDQASLAFIAFSKDNSDDEASNRYEELNRLVNDHYNRITALYRPIYNSVFRSSFFDGWSEEEISDALLRSDACDEELLALKNKSDDEIKRYQSLDQESRDFMKESAQIYRSIVETNRKIARKMGYDSYPEYSYKYEYGRDFTPADAQIMYRYVQEYILPLGIRIKKELENDKNSISLERTYRELDRTSVSPESMAEKLKPYYKKLGDDLSRSFDAFQKNYYASALETGLPNAYTIYLDYYEHPVCFFGPGCQGLLTYVHEQGHYNAFRLSSAGVSSFDLCEVQSQGNEWLYMAYIKDDYTADQYRFLTRYHLYDSILTVMLATCCDAFEQYVYAHPELGASDYDNAFIEQAKAIGLYDFLWSELADPISYWHRAIVANSMYYLSYAVSKIPSIEVFVTVQNEGFDAAAAKYKKLLTVDADAGFVASITNAGFSSPFTEEPYRKIAQTF